MTEKCESVGTEGDATGGDDCFPSLSDVVAMAVKKHREQFGAGTRPLFSRTTRAFVYMMQSHPVKRMLDFDFLCQRESPSVAGIIQPDSKAAHQIVQFGQREIKIPIFQSISKAVVELPDVDVLINYVQKASVFQTSLIALNTQSIRTVVITSEGIPERDIKKLIAAAERNKKVLIGPGTVGGIQAGGFKIGDTSGTAENVIMCKLYRPGSIGAVCRSSGMLNELCYILAKNTDGLNEGIVVGAHQFISSAMLEHLLRLQAIDEIKMLVVIGEPGGTGELEIAQAYREGYITKPVVAWVLGSCGDGCVSVDLRYGRASTGRMATAETASAKLAALREAGFIVPESFEALASTIAATYKRLVESGELIPATDSPSQFIASIPPQHPQPSHQHKQQQQQQQIQPSSMVPGMNSQFHMNIPGYTVVQRASPSPPLTDHSQVDHRHGQHQSKQASRPRTSIISSISDDRVSEPAYCGQPLSILLQENVSIGDVIALLWFKRRVPAWASKFLELCIIVLADKGPCSPAAHNTIVASRSGKDVVSCLCSGLLNIGPRYGGGGDDAARCWLAAVESKLTPAEFVEKMRRQSTVIRGIGVPVATKSSMPETRIGFLKNYAQQNFPTRRFLSFAEEVEKITSSKSRSLILNLDGMLGVLFLDMMDGCPAFSKTEMTDLVTFGCLSGLFAFSRSIGLIGHAIDQKRLKQPLYFHQFDDVNYVNQSVV